MIFWPIGAWIGFGLMAEGAALMLEAAYQAIWEQR